ncbi:unnamed protein product [Sympodiomycopsis kandeliae]
MAKRGLALTLLSTLVLMLALRFSRPNLTTNLFSSSLSFLSLHTTTTMSSASFREARLRKWHERMSDDHGWLRTFLTFSFAGHYDPKWTSFGPLRVINEDRISAQTGFPTHSHSNYEIFSYVLDGELSHKDSMGNIETLKRGEIQYTRAGTGIRHSEWNDQKDGKDTHFMQIWFSPDKDKQRVPPVYFSTQTPTSLKENKLHTLIKPASTVTSTKTGLLPPGDAIPAHASIVVRASILDSGNSVSHTWGTDSDVSHQSGSERYGVIHLAMRSGYKDPEFKEMGIKGEAKVKVSTPDGKEWILNEGDSVFFRGVKVGQEVKVENVTPSNDGKQAEFLLFDLKAEDGDDY